MKDFLTNISSLSWWISVVIVGILINLFSAYLKDKFDNYLASISSWWRNKSEAQKAKRQRQVDLLRSNSHEQIMFGLRELRNRLRCIQLFLLGILHFGAVAAWSLLPFTTTEAWLQQLAKTVLLAVGALYMFIGVRRFDRAVYMKNLLVEARKEVKSNDNH